MPNTANPHLTARRLKLEADILAAIAANGGRMTSKALAERFDTKHTLMSKRMVRMHEAGLVVRLGVAKCDAFWGDAADPTACKQAAADAAVPREPNRSRRPLPGGFTQRVVSAAKRKVPQRLGPRPVFELGARA